MAVTQDAVFEKLKNVIDPELFVNIVDLGLIYEVKFNAEDQSTQLAATDGTEDSEAISESAPQNTADPEKPPQSDTSQEAAAVVGEGCRVHIEMTMTSPACPAGPQLIEGAKREVSSLEGVDQVEVRIVLDPPWTPDRMTEDAKDQLGIF